MFLVALLLLLLLGALAVIIVVQNYSILLSTDIHFTIFSFSLPRIPVLLLCVFSVLLGGLILYVIAARAARRDIAEMKKLRERIKELEEAQGKPASNPPTPGFAPSVVPLPGLASGSNTGGSGSANPSGPTPALPGAKQPGPGMPMPASTMNQWPAPPPQPPYLSPSDSGNTLALPPRMFAPQPPPSPQQQMGRPRPPFPQS